MGFLRCMVGAWVGGCCVCCVLCVMGGARSLVCGEVWSAAGFLVRLFAG